MTEARLQIDVIEEWRGREWSRTNHSIVETQDGSLLTLEREGTVGTYASSRGVPGREGLSRAERKFTALETLEVRMREVPASIDTLHFWRPGRYARINRGWSKGRFLGWYVNFERPPSVHPDRIITMDLVLDALVAPDGAWSWKDREDFDEALRRGLVTQPEAREVWAETERVRAELDERQGPFAEVWDSWTPGRDT